MRRGVDVQVRAIVDDRDPRYCQKGLGRSVKSLQQAAARRESYERWSHDDSMVGALREDPVYAAQLLSRVIEDGDDDELQIALRQMAKAFGCVARVTENTRLNSTDSYLAVCTLDFVPCHSPVSGVHL